MPTARAESNKSRRREEVEGAFPALSFHYGLSFTELVRMPRAIMRIYIEALPGLIASEQLRALEAASFPHLSEDSERQAIVRRLQSHVEEDASHAPVPRSIEEAKNLTAAAGIAITVVGKDGKEVSP